MTTEISNSDDIIDSRDVVERIAELEAEVGECAYCGEQVSEEQPGGLLVTDTESADEARHCGISDDHLHYTDGDKEQELDSLLKLQEEGESATGEWHDGATLIRDSYFEDYAEQLAEDIGAINPKAASWPLNCIDWEQAARELQMDYTSISFDGTDYWVR